MEMIDIFYQGEQLGEVQHLALDASSTFGVLQAAIREKHGIVYETFLFLENGEEIIEERVCISEHARGANLKVHVHRCRHVEVTVGFNGRVVEGRFSPASTVAKIKRWAAEEKFGMTPEEAGEHVLQIAGTHDRPAPGTHVGALTDGRVCGVGFDLVPDERVNGASEAGE
jgi:hypothetical protein